MHHASFTQCAHTAAPFPLPLSMPFPNPVFFMFTLLCTPCNVTLVFSPLSFFLDVRVISDVSHFTATVAVTVPPECTQLDTARPALPVHRVAFGSYLRSKSVHASSSCSATAV